MLNICFHGVGVPRRAMEPGESRYWVGVDQFRSILDTVADDPRVRISFDDGNDSDVTHGLPELIERNLKATFFVLAGRLGTPGSLAAADVQALVAAGMTIGTHGMDHRPWRGLTLEVRRRELVDARQVIRDVSGQSVDEAALPLGRYDRSLLRELRRLGYSCVHTSDRRWARPGQWLQPRFSAREDDSPATIRRDVLSRAGWGARLERAAVCTAKRWR